MKKKLLLLMLLVLPFFISSCSDDDGKVDPMKWKTEAKKSSDGYFHVSPEGGTFVLQCTNYNDFWITGITEQEAKGEEKKFTPAIDDHKHFTITSDWTFPKLARHLGCSRPRRKRTTHQRLHDEEVLLPLLLTVVGACGAF